jgi:hypothetical protein
VSGRPRPSNQDVVEHTIKYVTSQPAQCTIPNFLNTSAEADHWDSFPLGYQGRNDLNWEIEQGGLLYQVATPPDEKVDFVQPIAPLRKSKTTQGPESHA